MSAASPQPDAHLGIHATGIVLGAVGLVIRGPSGAGKSLLALELMDRWQVTGPGAWLVGDDRIDVRRHDGALTMSAPARMAGLIELRGYGIVERPFRPTAPIDLVIDLVEDLVRLPEPESFADELLGVRLPRCPVPRRGVVDSGHQMQLVAQALRHVAASGLGKTQEIT